MGDLNEKQGRLMDAITEITREKQRAARQGGPSLIMTLAGLHGRQESMAVTGRTQGRGYRLSYVSAATAAPYLDGFGRRTGGSLRQTPSCAGSR
jgi:hypothetical protein